MTVTYFTPPGGKGRTTAWSNAPGGFLVFLVVTCPGPPVFARPNKYSSCFLLHRERAFILGDRNIFYTRGGGRTTAESNALGAFLVACSFASFLFYFISARRGLIFISPISVSLR